MIVNNHPFGRVFINHPYGKVLATQAKMNKLVSVESLKELFISEVEETSFNETVAFSKEKETLKKEAQIWEGGRTVAES